MSTCKGIWRSEKPARTADLGDLSRGAPIALPEEYLAFLQECNGGEGDLAVQPWWAAFWPAEQVLELNGGYGVVECVPGFFAFGSNGGGEMLAFDIRAGAPYPIVAIPFIPMDAKYALPVAANFREFRALLGQTCEEQIHARGACSGLAGPIRRSWKPGKSTKFGS